jgi:hypothetical protein
MNKVSFYLDEDISFLLLAKVLVGLQVTRIVLFCYLYSYRYSLLVKSKKKLFFKAQKEEEEKRKKEIKKKRSRPRTS